MSHRDGLLVAISTQTFYNQPYEFCGHWRVSGALPPAVAYLQAHTKLQIMTSMLSVHSFKSISYSYACVVVVAT